MEHPLYQKLQQVTGYKKDRQKMANEILADKSLFPQLLYKCFNIDDGHSFKACWVLELVCIERLEWLIPHIDHFIESLKVLKHDSSIRPIGKICELLCNSYFHKKTYM